MQPQQWQWQRKDIFGYIISEKGTGAEICPAIVSAIVTGRSAIGHFFPCPWQVTVPESFSKVANCFLRQKSYLNPKRIQAT